MRNIFYVLFLTLLLVGCTDDEKTEEIVLDPPVMTESSPVNGATDIASGEIEFMLTFDQNVTTPSSGHSLVYIEGATITDVSSYLKEVTITASGLVKENDYSLVIPEGVILGPTKVSADEITINFSTVASVDKNIDSELATSNPSTEAVNVYNYLVENYGTQCLSSVHANVNWNINEAEWVKYHTGKYPAMTTVDYIHLPASPANWIDYSQTSFLEDWWDNNGLVCANWHWIVPRYEGDTDTNNFTYEPGNTTWEASNVLVEGTWENAIAMADLEELAGYLKLLQEKNIPVIWRPFHEAAGNTYEYTNGTAWFWWGYDGAEVYKELWIYMFNYFQEQGLNNLIWVWTTQTKDNDFYPGDEYVDIVGRDIYNDTDQSDIASQFTTIQETYPNKMVTLSEMGDVANISDQWTSGAKWSYFMPWYDYDATNNPDDLSGTDHYHANAAWWIDAMNQDYVISRDEMPSLK